MVKIQIVVHQLKHFDLKGCTCHGVDPDETCLDCRLQVSKTLLRVWLGAQSSGSQKWLHLILFYIFLFLKHSY